MRILFVTNYYPPYEVGGYEQLCRDVATQLVERGHATCILTSNRGASGQRLNEPDIYRVLHRSPNFESRLSAAAQFFFSRRRNEAHNNHWLRRAVTLFSADVVFIWNLQGLPRSIAIEAESLPNVAVAYWLAGYSPAEPDGYWRYWTRSGTTLGIEVVKQLMRRLALSIMRSEGKPIRPRMRHVGVVSEYMRRKGIADGTLPQHAKVIYNGVEIEQFLKPVRIEVQGSLNLLQAGRVSSDKGVHTAVESVGFLVREHHISNIHLCIAGSGPADYLAFLQQLVNQYSIEDKVSFLGWLPREKLPEIISKSDVLLLPSIHPEGFARVVLEAMAGGLTVIGTLAGGTGEILQNGITGLTFPAEDSQELARQIKQLLLEPSLRQCLAAQGQKLVLERFSLEHMVNNVEQFLEQALPERVTAA